MKISYLVLFFFLIGQPAFAQKMITLETAKGMALKRNNALKMATQSIAAAQATKAGARALLYPNVNVSTTGFYFGKPISDLVPGYGASATLAINQWIYNGGKIKLGIEAAQQELEIQEIQKTITEADLLLKVEQRYWQIVSLNSKGKLLENNKALLQALLDDLNHALNAGTIYKNEVLRAQVAMNTVRLNLLKLNDDLVVAKLSLAQIIGLQEDETFTISEDVSGRISPAPEMDTFDVAQRPEISLLEQVIKRQRLQTAMQKADHQPTVSVNVNGVTAFGKKGINFGNPNSNNLTSYYGLFSVGIPIFDGGAARQKIKAQEYEVSAQQIQLEETRQILSIEVRKAYLQLNQAYQKIELSQASLAQAEENLRLSNDRFKAGLMVSKDVIEAQNIWERANNDVIDAKVQFKISEAELKKALGTLK